MTRNAAWKRRLGLLLGLLLTVAGGLVGQDVYRIDPAYPVHPFRNFLEVLPDAGRELSVSRLAGDTTLSWQPYSSLSARLDPGQRYHARIKVVSREALADWQLHWEDGMYRDIAWVRGNGSAEAWAFADGELLWHRTTGADQFTRDLGGPQVLDRVRFTLPANRTVVLYLTVSGNAFGMMPNLNLTLRAPEYVHHQPMYPDGPLYNAFNFGLTSIIFLYHLLLFVFLRERVYGWFALWLLLCAITQGMTIGLEPTRWLLPLSAHARFLGWLVIPHAMLFTFWLFGRSFTESRSRYPWLDRAMLCLPVGMLLQIAVEVGYVVLFDPPISLTGFAFHYPLILLYALTGCAIALGLIWKPDPLARLFGAGALAGSLLIAIGSLWAMRIVRVPIDPFGTAVLVQIMIYSVGLAYRRSLNRKREREAELTALRDRSEIARMRDLEDVKARFFANVSHEFRTPLTLISGPLEQAYDRMTGNERDGGAISLTSRDYSILRSSVDRLRKLVDQLLALSQLESGKVFLKLRKGGVVSFIRRQVLAFVSLAEQGNVSLDTCFPDENRDAFYDADKLETIVVNLVANAIKYAPGRGRVSVKLAMEEAYITLEVTDNGPGIPPDQLDHIFERFYRVDGTGVEGSGIGLALTKELVDVYGGTISVSSAVGKGTTFRLRLPCALTTLPPGVLADDAARIPEMRPALPDLSDRTDKREFAGDGDAVVLVVEDSPELRDFIAAVLSPHYQVLEATDGEAGERMALEHVPDLVVSDVMMPKKDGFALCHALKNNPKTNHVPVILLTAKADRQSTLSGLNQGADDYLAKPFDPKELRLRIRNLLEGRERIWQHFQSLDLTLLPDVDDRSVEDRFLQQVIGCIKNRLADEALSVDQLAREVGYSRSQLTRKVKALTGKTPNKLISEMRLHEARRLLRKRAGSVSEIAYSVGFSNLSYFAKSFRSEFGSLPSEVLEESA